MSFLEPDDDRAALEEALRFIDEFVLPLDGPGALANSGDKQADGAVARKHPKRVRDPAVYARRRMKQKNEMLALRQQEKTLERQLLKLRRGPSPPVPPVSESEGDDGTTSESSAGSDDSKRRAKRRVTSWLVAASSEQHKRQASEFINTQLRQALAAQSTVSQALVEFVGQYSNSTAMEIERKLNRFLLYTRAVRMGPPRSVGNANVASDIANQLRATVQRLVLEANSSLDGSTVDAVSNEHNIKHDPVVGMYAETRGAAPLSGKLEHLADYLQHNFWKTKFPPHMAKQGMKTTTREKHDYLDVALQGLPVRFSGISILHKSSEADRLVFTYSTLLFHPSGKLCFREGGWLIVQKSPVNPASKSVYRSCSRIAPDVCNGVSILDGLPIDQIQSLAMAALGVESKLRHQAVQRKLLLETGRNDLADLLPDIDPFVDQTAVYWNAR